MTVDEFFKEYRAKIEAIGHKVGYEQSYNGNAYIASYQLTRSAFGHPVCEATLNNGVVWCSLNLRSVL